MGGSSNFDYPDFCDTRTNYIDWTIAWKQYMEMKSKNGQNLMQMNVVKTFD